jgi:biotin-[acetyl-CoA-carboxylase] ligase BirA-like protein
MLGITDNPKFCELYLNEPIVWKRTTANDLDDNIRLLAKRMFLNNVFYFCELQSITYWRYLFAVEYIEDSQYDLLINASHDYEDLPGGILCLAGSGEKFHGYRNRPWASKMGNVHLSVYLSPHLEISHFSVGFIILSAVSVVQSIDLVKGLNDRAKIKWVNDVLIDDAKVCGVLAHTQVQGGIVTDAVLGIGLNVEAEPKVHPTPFVPKTASLSSFVEDKSYCNQGIIFNKLIRNLELNYNSLMRGDFDSLLKIYKDRSMIFGKEVKVWSDVYAGTSELLAEGKVLDIGDELELIIEGIESPITSGRLEIINK